MNFLIRVDASIQIGSGHVMRCLTVAQALSDSGHNCIFVMRKHDGNLIDHIVEKGYRVLVLNPPPPWKGVFKDEYQQWLGVTEREDVNETIGLLKLEKIKIDWVIVDHYGLSAEWEQIVSSFTKKILVIDDLANRKHYADIILDCGVVADITQYFKLNINSSACYLLGPKYALLRSEFNFYRKKLEEKNDRYKKNKFKILLNMGGMDKDDVTSRVMSTLEHFKKIKNIELTIVMGRNAPWKNEVLRKATELYMKTDVLIDFKNMAELMVESDLAIGAAGSTAWERCCLGLPTVMICIADNQKVIAQELHRLGATISIKNNEVSEKLLNILNSINKEKLSDMQNQAFKITEGLGVELLLKAVFEKSVICQ